MYRHINLNCRRNYSLRYRKTTGFWKPNTAIVLRIVIAMLSVFMFSCGYIDLRQIHYDLYPEDQDHVLESLETPIQVAFDTEMEKRKTEAAFSVLYSAGQVEGEFEWKDRVLVFTPVGGWKPGTRYTLHFKGTIVAKDGREELVDSAVHFFALVKKDAPILAEFSPVNGASVGVDEAGGAFIHLVFSSAMNCISVEEGFSVDGGIEKVFFWSSPNEIKVSFKKKLNPWTVYRWTLGKDVASEEGIAIVKTYSGTFVTDIDRVRPKVVGMYPMLKSVRPDGSYGWSRVAPNMESGPGFSDGIGIEFNKEMDNLSVLQSVSIEPTISGHVEQLGAKHIVFMPDKPFLPEKTYFISIKSDTKDVSGLPINEEFKLSFVADIPYLRIQNAVFIGESIHVVSGANLKNNALIQIPINKATGELLLKLTFSPSITTESMLELPNSIMLQPHFPYQLGWTQVQNINWLFGNILQIEFIGLVPGDSGSKHFYKLSIPGGISGINNGNGSFMEESMTVYIEAIS